MNLVSWSILLSLFATLKVWWPQRIIIIVCHRDPQIWLRVSRPVNVETVYRLLKERNRRQERKWLAADEFVSVGDCRPEWFGWSIDRSIDLLFFIMLGCYLFVIHLCISQKAALQLRMGFIICSLGQVYGIQDQILAACVIQDRLTQLRLNWHVYAVGSSKIDDWIGLTSSIVQFLSAVSNDLMNFVLLRENPLLLANRRSIAWLHCKLHDGRVFDMKPWV